MAFGRAVRPTYIGGFSGTSGSGGSSSGGAIGFGRKNPSSSQPSQSATMRAATSRGNWKPAGDGLVKTTRKFRRPDEMMGWDAPIAPEYTADYQKEYQKKVGGYLGAYNWYPGIESPASGARPQPQQPAAGPGYTGPSYAPAATTTTTQQSGEVTPLQPPGSGVPAPQIDSVTIPEKPSYLDQPELPDYTQDFQQYGAETREVQPMETMQGQIQNIMEEGNPLMDLARTRADQQMAARGLFHSTSGIEAAEKAMLDSVLPIASQDAATYSNQARINQEFLQNAANMNTETFNNEVVARANQGRQMQLMSYESDIRERLAGVDQRYAMQLETLSQEYNILGEQYKQAGTLYSDSLRSIASLLGNNQLTPEQQAAGVESLVGQLEAGLQFMTGVSGGTTGGNLTGGGTTTEGGGEGQATTAAGTPVAGISNQQTLGVYPGNEVDAKGEHDNAALKEAHPIRGLGDAKAPDPDILRVDRGSGYPSLMKVGQWYYRPIGWNERTGMANSQILQQAGGGQYIEFAPMDAPEQQRVREGNPVTPAGGGRWGGAQSGFDAPNLYMQV